MNASERACICALTRVPHAPHSISRTSASTHLWNEVFRAIVNVEVDKTPRAVAQQREPHKFHHLLLFIVGESTDRSVPLRTRQEQQEQLRDASGVYL